MNSQVALNDIYAEGDIDKLFFGFLSGWVSHDPKEISYGKNNQQIFEQTLQLVQYLIQTGDFEAGRMIGDNPEVKFIIYKDGFSGFINDAQKLFEADGLYCDGLSWQLALNKINFGKTAPLAPEFIQHLVQA